MSSKTLRGERRSAKHLPMTAKCLALVLSPKATKAEENAADGSSALQHNGKEILEDFKLRNKTCYWNPALIESIRGLEYLGFVAPCTILVGGEEIHLENLRSAWGRRVLKGPLRYNIERIGDVSGIEMQEIPQTQFIPLPDALCLIILELNQSRVLATLDTVREQLTLWYRHTSLPPDSLIYDTLGALIRERKVFHTGSGYYVVTPDTFRLAVENPNVTMNASWLPYHPMYIPVFPQHLPQPAAMALARAPMRSISCQANMEPQEKAPVQPQPSGKARHSRSNSIRGSRSQSKSEEAAEGEELKRAVSAKYNKADKTKASIKDANLKTSNINQEKEKGEKVSLFSKLFGRNKKKASAPPPPPAVKEVEYATFSAQFPPPEWLWYQQQQEKQRRTEEWVTSQIAKGSTTRQQPSTAAPDKKGGDSGGPGPLMRHPPPGVVAGEGGHGERKRHSHHGGGRIRDSFHGGKSRRDKVHPGDDRRHSSHFHGDASKPAVPAAQCYVDGGSGATPLLEENIYQSVSSPTNHPTPRKEPPPVERHHYDSIPPEEQSEEPGAMASHQLYPDRFQSHVHSSHHRSCHRSKRRAYRQSYFPLDGNDISIEYKGKLPKRNSSYVQSRESGVNCVGLGHFESSKSPPSHVCEQETMPPSPAGQRETTPLNLRENLNSGETTHETQQPEERCESAEEQPKLNDSTGSSSRENSSTAAVDGNLDDSLEDEDQTSQQQTQIKPEIILDNEPHFGCYDPDVARSRPQSQCESTVSESERSVETVIPAHQQVGDGGAAPSGDPLGGELRELSIADSGISSPQVEDGRESVAVNGGQNQGKFFNDVHTCGQNSEQLAFSKHCHSKQSHRMNNHTYGIMSEACREDVVVHGDKKHRIIEVGKDNYVMYDDRRHRTGDAERELGTYDERLHHMTEAGKENFGVYEDRKHRSKSLHRGDHHRSDHVLNNQRSGRVPKVAGTRPGHVESARPRSMWALEVTPEFQQFRQQHTLAAKHFDLNGDFEVVGVV